MGNPKSDEMNMKVLEFKYFLLMLPTVAKNKDQEIYEDYVESLRVFDKERNDAIMGVEIRHVLVTLGDKMTEEEVEMLVAGHEDSNGRVNYEELVQMVLNGSGHPHILSLCLDLYEISLWPQRLLSLPYHKAVCLWSLLDVCC